MSSEPNKIIPVFASISGAISILMALTAIVLAYVAPMSVWLSYLAIPFAFFSLFSHSGNLLTKIFLVLFLLSHWGYFFIEDNSIVIETPSNVGANVDNNNPFGEQ